MDKQHKPPTMQELLKMIKPVSEPTNPRKLFDYYCQRSGQGRFTRSLRCKADRRKARKQQRAARKAARA